MNSGAGLRIPAIALAGVLLAGPATLSLSAQTAPGPAPRRAPVNPNRPVPGETHEAKRLKRLSKVRIRLGQLHVRYARELHSVGKLRAALRSFDDFLILYPKHDWVFYALRESADIYLKLSRPRIAVDYLRRAYRTAHNEERGALAYLRSGKILAEMRRTAEARRIFRELAYKWKRDSRVSRLALIELKSLRILDGNRTTTEIDRSPGSGGSNLPEKGRNPAGQPAGNGGGSKKGPDA